MRDVVLVHPSHCTLHCHGERFGAKVTAQYAVLGPYDFVSIVECPDNETITRVSVELSSRGSVRLITLPAMPVANFVRNLKG